MVQYGVHLTIQNSCLADLIQGEKEYKVMYTMVVCDDLLKAASIFGGVFIFGIIFHFGVYAKSSVFYVCFKGKILPSPTPSGIFLP